MILLNRNSNLSPPWGWPVEPKEAKQAGILKKRIQFDTWLIPEIIAELCNENYFIALTLLETKAFLCWELSKLTFLFL